MEVITESASFTVNEVAGFSRQNQKVDEHIK